MILPVSEPTPEQIIHQDEKDFCVFGSAGQNTLAVFCNRCGQSELFEIHPGFIEAEIGVANVLAEVAHTHACPDLFK